MYLLESVQVFNRGQTGFPVRHIYDGVGFAKFTELKTERASNFSKDLLFFFLSVGKLSLS